MKIWAHSESHIIELDDGSRWLIFPGDLDLTLNWKPETEISVAPAEDNLGSHVLVGAGAKVRVIPEGESWPVREVKNALKDAGESPLQATCGRSCRNGCDVAFVTSEDINIKDVEMAIEDRETFNLIGSDKVEGANEYGPDGQKSVTSSVYGSTSAACLASATITTRCLKMGRHAAQDWQRHGLVGCSS